MSCQPHIFWITFTIGFFLGIVCLIWVIGLNQIIKNYKCENRVR